MFPNCFSLKKLWTLSSLASRERKTFHISEQVHSNPDEASLVYHTNLRHTNSHSTGNSITSPAFQRPTARVFLWTLFNHEQQQLSFPSQNDHALQQGLLELSSRRRDDLHRYLRSTRPVTAFTSSVFQRPPAILFIGTAKPRATTDKLYAWGRPRTTTRTAWLSSQTPSRRSSSLHEQLQYPLQSWPTGAIFFILALTTHEQQQISVTPEDDHAWLLSLVEEIVVGTRPVTASTSILHRPEPYSSS